MLVDDQGRLVRIGIYGLAIDADARPGPSILLTRLAPDELDADFWTLPGGGLDWGEHPLECLNREFIEETGLEPRPLGLLGIHSFSLSSEQRRRPGPPIQVLQAVYEVVAEGNPIHEVAGSTIEARWILLTELESLPLVELVKASLAFKAGLSLDSGSLSPD